MDPETGEEVGYDQIVKGYELTKDRYVVITPRSSTSLDPEKTRTVDIEDFVDLDEIDPVYYDHPYYLVPDKGATKAYGLLLGAMKQANKVAIARVVLRSKEQLVAIRPAGDVLMMETMLFHDEVVPSHDIEDLPDGKELKATDRELKMAQQLIDSLSSEFDPTSYHDEYREKVLELIEKKASGEEIAVQPEAPEPAKVPDLMAALEASLAAVKDPEAGKKKKSDSASNGSSKSGSKSKSKEKTQGLVHLEPHPRARAVVDAPAVRQLLDQHEAPARRAQRIVRRRLELEAVARVVDLDPQAGALHRDHQPHGLAARVAHGVGHELGDEQPDVAHPVGADAVAELVERAARPRGRRRRARELDVDHHAAASSPERAGGSSTNVRWSSMRVIANTRWTASGPRTSTSRRSTAPSRRSASATSRSPLESMNSSSRRSR